MPASLIANTDVFHAAARYMHRSSSSNLVMLVGISSLLLFWAALYSWERFRKSAASDGKTAKDLFADLCRIHRLTRAQRHLLEVAAVHARPEQISQIFVDPNLLNGLALATSPHAEEYRNLHRKLFGDLTAI